MRKAAVKEKRAVQSMQDLWGVQDIQDMKTCKTFYGADGETRIVNIHNGFQAHRFLKFQNTYQKHEACTNKLIGLSPSPKASTRFPIFSPQGITP